MRDDDLTGAEGRALQREAEVWTRYLTGGGAGSPTFDAYRRLHTAVLRPGSKASEWDLALAAWASRGPRRAFLADTYARFFAPTGLLRRKLVLMTAVLENSSDSFHHFVLQEELGIGRVIARLGIGGARIVLGAALAVIVLAPRHAWYRVRGRTS